MSAAKIPLIEGFELRGEQRIDLLLTGAWRLLILQHDRKGQICKDRAFNIAIAVGRRVVAEHTVVDQLPVELSFAPSNCPRVSAFPIRPRQGRKQVRALHNLVERFIKHRNKLGRFMANEEVLYFSVVERGDHCVMESNAAFV